MVGCCVGRSKGKCRGDENGTFTNCYSKTSSPEPGPQNSGTPSEGGSWCSCFRSCPALPFCSCEKCKLPRKHNVAKSPPEGQDALGRSQANSVEMGQSVHPGQVSVNSSRRPSRNSPRGPLRPRGPSNGPPGKRLSVTDRGFQSVTSPLN